MKLFKEDYFVILRKTEEGLEFVRSLVSGGVTVASDIANASKFSDKAQAQTLADKEDNLFVYKLYEKEIIDDDDSIRIIVKLEKIQ